MYGKSILWDMVDKLLKRDLICTKYFRREDSLKIEAIFWKNVNRLQITEYKSVYLFLGKGL